MKIFNTEKGIEKVYVQIKDIDMLSNSDSFIPASIFEKVFTNPVALIINDRNRMEFLEFTDPHEIEFFKSLDWIVDYKEIRNLTQNQIKVIEERIKKRMLYIRDTFNIMSDEDKLKNQSLIVKFDLLEYKRNSIIEILSLKKGQKDISLPLVPDSNGFTIKGKGTAKDYIIKASLNPNKLLLFRKDGKKLTDSDRIPPSFIMGAVSLSNMERSKKGDMITPTYEINNFLSDNQEYLVTEISPIKKKKSSIKKLVKKILKK